MEKPLIISVIGDSIVDELLNSYYIDPVQGIQCNWDSVNQSYDTLNPESETCYSTFGGYVLGNNHTPTLTSYFVELIAKHLDQNAYVLDIDTPVDDFPYDYTEILDENSDLYNEENNVGVISVNAAVSGSGLWEHRTHIEDMAYLSGYSESQVADYFDLIDFFGFPVEFPDNSLPFGETIITYENVLSRGDIVYINIFGNDILTPEFFEFSAWFCPTCWDTLFADFDWAEDTILYRPRHGEHEVSPGCQFKYETIDAGGNTLLTVYNCNEVFKAIAGKIDSALQTFNQDPTNEQLPIYILHNLPPSEITVDGETYVMYDESVSPTYQIINWNPSQNNVDQIRTFDFWSKGFADLLDICFHGEDYNPTDHTFFANEGGDMRTILCGEINPYDNLLIVDFHDNSQQIISDYLVNLGDSASVNEDVFLNDGLHLKTEFAQYVAEVVVFNELLELYNNLNNEPAYLLHSGDVFDPKFNQKVYEVFAEPCNNAGDYLDCNGDCGGPALMDNCGQCDSDPNNNCTQDCNGDWGGNALGDICGTCDNDPTNNCYSLCAGDVNGDNSINVLDVVGLVNMILDSDIPVSSAADVNADGVINVLDVVSLVNSILDPESGCESECGEDFTADCSTPTLCVADDVWKNNSTCDSPNYLFDFECADNNCEDLQCGKIPSNGSTDTCAFPTTCGQLATHVGLDNLVPLHTDSSSYWSDYCRDPNPTSSEECIIYSFNEELGPVENFQYIYETILDCSNQCVPYSWIGDDICNDGSGMADLDCFALDCDGGDCGAVPTNETCFTPTSCADVESYLGLVPGSTQLVGDYYCSAVTNEQPGDDCDLYSFEEELDFVENLQYKGGTIVDCENKCVPSIFIGDGTCSNGSGIAHLECTDLGPGFDCDGGDCGLATADETCVLPSSCDELATYFDQDLAPVGGGAIESCGVVDAAQDPGTTGCNIYVWENAYEDVENYIFTGDTVVDCNHTCTFSIRVGDSNCHDGDAGIASNLTCLPFNCDGGDCGLLTTEGGECIVPTGCPDLAYLMGVDAEDIQAVGATGCSVTGDENSQAPGTLDCTVYSWDTNVDNVEQFVYTGVTIVDCNSTCSFQDWVGDGYCDDAGMEWGSHLDCPVFDCDGGDCGTSPSNDGSQECVPTHALDWIGDNGRYTDPDDDGIF